MDLPDFQEKLRLELESIKRKFKILAVKRPRMTEREITIVCDIYRWQYDIIIFSQEAEKGNIIVFFSYYDVTLYKSLFCLNISHKKEGCFYYFNLGNQEDVNKMLSQKFEVENFQLEKIEAEIEKTKKQISFLFL